MARPVGGRPGCLSSDRWTYVLRVTGTAILSSSQGAAIARYLEDAEHHADDTRCKAHAIFHSHTLAWLPVSSFLSAWLGTVSYLLLTLVVLTGLVQFMSHKVRTQSLIMRGGRGCMTCALTSRIGRARGRSTQGSVTPEWSAVWPNTCLLSLSRFSEC